MPICRQTSSAVAPFSVCRTAKAICSFIELDPEAAATMARVLQDGEAAKVVGLARGSVDSSGAAAAGGVRIPLP